jgi:hypothetical protein
MKYQSIKLGALSFSGPRNASQPSRGRILAAGVVLASAVAVSGCGPAPEEAAPGAQVVMLTSGSNWSIVTHLTLPNVEIQAEADVEVCWDKVTTEIRCRPFSPQTIQRAVFGRVDKLTPAVVQQKLELGNLASPDTSEVVYFSALAAGKTCAKFSEMKNLAGTANMVPATENQEKAASTYFVNVSDTTDPGVGTRAIMYVTPKKSSTVTHVDLPSDACGNILTFEGKFAAAVSVPAKAALTVNWSAIRALNTNGTDVNLPPAAVSKAQLGFFAGKTASEVQSNILQLETAATRLWEKDLTGGASQTSLEDLKERAGGAALSTLGGLAAAGQGTWVLALSSKKTQNPAPVVLVVLQPM